MTELKFDNTKEYGKFQLEEIERQAKNILDDIKNYRDAKKKNLWKNIINFEKKYIKYEDDGDIMYMYVEGQIIDKWSNGITLLGVEFGYNQSEYKDDVFFSYDPMHNFYINYNDFIEATNKGDIKEISKEEFEIFFKEATEWALQDGLRAAGDSNRAMKKE